MFGIDLCGPYKDISGIALTTREMALALYDMGIPVRLSGIDDWSSLQCELTKEQHIKINQMENTQLPDDSVYIQNIPMTRLKHFQAGVPNVCFTLFETDRCPFIWPLIEKQVPLDEIWTATDWGRRSFIKGGLPEEKIKVVPLGIDTKKYNPSIAPAKVIGRRGFMFYSSMDYKNSKGPDVLLNAYMQEFTASDDVTLVFKAYSGFNLEHSKARIRETIAKYRNANKSTAHILFIGDQLGEDEIAALHRAANCYVLPTRGEGWNLGTIQSMACGVPALVTDATAHRSFLNETNGLLIKCQQIPITDVSWLLREPMQCGHEWWNPDIEDLKKQMRWAYEHPTELKALGQKAHRDVQDLSWFNTADKIIGRAIDLLEQTAS